MGSKNQGGTRCMLQTKDEMMRGAAASARRCEGQQQTQGDARGSSKRKAMENSCVPMLPTVEENVPAAQGMSLHMPVYGHCVPAPHASHDVDADSLAY
jgi:hypothetical protein